MRCVLFVITLFSAACCWSPASCQSALAQAVDAVVTDWMSSYGIPNAAVAVSARGRLIGSFDHGWSASSEHPIGSLSKAITGFCISRMLDGGRMKLSDTIGAVLKDYFADPRNPAPVDDRFKAITIEQLLVHRSGLVRNAFRPGDGSIEQSFRSATLSRLRADPGTMTGYSNTGYLVLGYIAQTVAAQDYQTVCGESLARLTGGRAGTVDPTLLYRAPNGGWLESAETYARFIAFLDPATAGLGRISRTWLHNLEGSVDDTVSDNGTDAPPCSLVAGAPSYGFGACVQSSARGFRFFHDGAVVGRPGGSMFFLNEAGYAAVVIFDVERNYQQLFDALDAALSTPQAYVVGSDRPK